jgi:hypothetical protein
LNRILHTDEKYIQAIQQWSEDYLYIVDDNETVDRKELTVVEKNALDITPQLYDFYELVLEEGEYIRHIIDYENKYIKIQRLAEWDTTKSHIYAWKAIGFVISRRNSELHKKKRIIF